MVMQPLVSAMTSLRNIFVAAIKSLLRGKSFIQAMLAFWINPAALKATDGGGGVVDGPKSLRPALVEDWLSEAEGMLLQPTEGRRLADFARKLKAQFRDRLLTDPACMLPSYNHQLPHGAERGQYLSLDVGGSTLRVALIELKGHDARNAKCDIVRISTFKITPDIKALEGMAFFDWMATRIIETVSKSLDRDHSPEKPIPMGLAWSFPIEQTSLKGGLLQGMGKGFLAANGLVGQDLGEIIKTACGKQGLNAELAAIVNDSTAALLSQAYAYPETRFGLILGTGVNIAVHLPVSTVGRAKFGARPATWFEKASHVVINTELGMFGKGILPRTRWDEVLNNNHAKPDFQPLEHLMSGYYLGEICRLALIEAIDTTGVFGGVVPPDLLLPYSLDTETISIIEADTSSALEHALSTFKSRHPSPAADPTVDDIAFLRTLASYISRRSAALVAASLFALWELKAETEAEFLASLGDSSSSNKAAAFADEIKAEMALLQTTVAFNGSVIEYYPGYLKNCQQYINELIASESSSPAASTASVELVPAKESSLMGAAVALACAEEGRAN